MAMTHAQKKAIYTLRQHPVSKTKEQEAAEYTLRNRGEDERRS